MSRRIPQHAVAVTSITYVKPSKPTPPHALFLADCDLVFADLPYIRHLFFYRVPQLAHDPSAFAALCRHLKTSLAATLALFYPLAGRVHTASLDARPTLDCNDEGVQFIEASLDCPLSAFEDNGFLIHEIFGDMTGLGDCPRCDMPGTPFLSIQVTNLKSGGVVVGSSMSHLIVDGHSFWHFLESWSKISQGLEGGDGSILQPLHMRAVLKKEVLSLYCPTHNLKALLLTHQTDIESNHDNLVGEANGNSTQSGYRDPQNENNHDNLITEVNGNLSQSANQDEDNDARTKGISGPKTNYGYRCGEGLNELHPKQNANELKQVVLHLPCDVVQQIKALCTPGHSTFEALVAYLWQHLTLARRLDPSQKVCLIIPINIRQKLLPPLTNAYYGNAVVPVFVEMTAGSITTVDLKVVATHIHEAISCVDDSFIKHHLLMKFTGQSPASKLQGCVVTCVINSPKFPCYNFNFGWGKPIAVRPVATPKEGNLDFYPSPPSYQNGSIDVCLALSNSTSQAFAPLGSITSMQNNQDP